MRRREFIALACGAAAAWPLEGRSQQASRTYRIAYLALAGTDDATIVKERLEELGYEEGKNLIFDLRLMLAFLILARPLFSSISPSMFFTILDRSRILPSVPMMPGFSRPAGP